MACYCGEGGIPPTGLCMWLLRRGGIPPPGLEPELLLLRVVVTFMKHIQKEAPGHIGASLLSLSHKGLSVFPLPSQGWSWGLCALVEDEVVYGSTPWRPILSQIHVFCIEK